LILPSSLTLFGALIKILRTRKISSCSRVDNSTRKKKSQQKVDGDLLLGALAHLLDRGDAATGSDPLTAADADGAWDLPWASVAPIKAWRYIPVPETFLVALGDTCALRSFVGPVAFEFSGPSGDWDPKNQAITFQFTQQKIGWGDTNAPFVDKELSNKKGDRVYRFYGES